MFSAMIFFIFVHNCALLKYDHQNGKDEKECGTCASIHILILNWRFTQNEKRLLKIFGFADFGPRSLARLCTYAATTRRTVFDSFSLPLCIVEMKFIWHIGVLNLRNFSPFFFIWSLSINYFFRPFSGSFYLSIGTQQIHYTLLSFINKRKRFPPIANLVHAIIRTKAEQKKNLFISIKW